MAVFSENIGLRLAIYESSLSDGELSSVTNRNRHARLVAVVSGTKSEEIMLVLRHRDEAERMKGGGDNHRPFRFDA